MKMLQNRHMNLRKLFQEVNISCKSIHNIFWVLSERSSILSQRSIESRSTKRWFPELLWTPDRYISRTCKQGNSLRNDALKISQKSCVTLLAWHGSVWLLPFPKVKIATSGEGSWVDLGYKRQFGKELKATKNLWRIGSSAGLVVLHSMRLILKAANQILMNK